MDRHEIACCITCKGRTPHLELTLPRNLAENPDCIFVLVDYNSQDHLTQYILSHHWSDIESGHLVVYTMLPRYEGFRPFRMAHAKNLAHRCAIREGAKILCNLDADNYAGNGFDRYMAESMENPGTYLWARMKKGELVRGISGRIVVDRHAYLKAGGYNEKYEVWGNDDRDFNQRVARLGYVGQEIPDRYLEAVPHSDKMRFREYMHARNNDYQQDEDVLLDDDSVIANFGQFGEGALYRNFDFKTPIVFGPLPTRIFGIGLHKTATTSLHKALQILGYDSAHWTSAHWAKMIWREMNTEGRSLTLEKHYALTDLPLSILFRKLDQAYPCSKFILTIRDELEWLDSVRRHWNPTYNPFRSGWDYDPFSHIIHQKLYGTTVFNEEVMLNCYRRHNDDVINYFRDRPSDLLVLNTGSCWEQLCLFLDVAIPEQPYPHLNINKEEKNQGTSETD